MSRAAAPPVTPTARDFDLAEVALESAAQSCQGGAILRGGKNIDPLAREYLHALDAVQAIRKERQEAAQDPPLVIVTLGDGQQIEVRTVGGVAEVRWRANQTWGWLPAALMDADAQKPWEVARVRQGRTTFEVAG